MKYFLPILFVFVSLHSFSQQPPLLNSYSYTNTDWLLNVCIDYQPNDTGTVQVQFQLAAEETGNIVLDQYFSINATQTTGCFEMLLPYKCTDYIVTMNMSNSHAYGPIQNPLFSFDAGCLSSLGTVTSENISVSASGKNLTIRSASPAPQAKAEIFDILGKKVAETNITTALQTLYVADTPGLYIVKISEAGRTLYTSKVAIR